MSCGMQGVPARVVVVSSSAHYIGDIDLQDLHYKHGRKYGAWRAYGARALPEKELRHGAACEAGGGRELFAVTCAEQRACMPACAGQSKLANILFARELAQREAGGNVKAYSLHPGDVLLSEPRSAAFHAGMIKDL